MKLAVLVVSWNGGDLLEDCINSVLCQDPPPQLMVVDNASGDGSPVRMHELAAASSTRGRIELVENTSNLGFTLAANRGIEHLLGRPEPPELVLLLNQDAMLEPGAARALIAAFDDDETIAAAGCKILFPDGETIQHAGGFIERPRMAARHHGHHEPAAKWEDRQRREVEFVTGAAMAVRATALAQVGLFNEIFSPGYFEDVELCQRLRDAGWKVVYIPDAVVRHAESSSFKGWQDRWALSHRNRLIFALPGLGDQASRAAFAASEQEFFASTTGTEELRAIARAYLAFLLILRRAARARLAAQRIDEATVDAVRRMAEELRNGCLELLHERIAGLLSRS